MAMDHTVIVEHVLHDECWGDCGWNTTCSYVCAHISCFSMHAFINVCKGVKDRHREHESEIWRGRKRQQEDVDTYRLMDGWKGNRKFWACGSVSSSVDLIWLTLCDRKLAEDLGGPSTGGHDGSDWQIYTCRHSHMANTVSNTTTYFKILLLIISEYTKQ